MYCVIQEVRRKKQDQYGEHMEIIPYPLEMSINGVEQVPKWCWKWSEERFERPHLEAYKISIHHSYRENSVVRKHQYPIRTMSYYDIVEYSLYDCADSSIQAMADKLGMEAAELYEIIEAKLEPLRERLEAEFHQSAEYRAKQEHRRILDAHSKAKAAFCQRYGVDGDEYDRCYDVFGVLRNRVYLEEIKAAHKARKQAERDRWSSYHESWSGTYSGDVGGSYYAPSVSTYTEADRAILKQFYRSLSKLYHPDLHPGEDFTAQMQLLNRLKELWGV